MSTPFLNRVLVVDDDVKLRRLLTSAFTNCGLSVDAARNGEEALRMAAEQRYSVVVLDLLMPALGGISVLEALNRNGSRPAPVVIVVTGAAPEAYASLDVRLVHGIVRKPFDVQDLTALVRSCVEIRSRAPYEKMVAAAIVGAPFITLFSRW